MNLKLFKICVRYNIICYADSQMSSGPHVPILPSWTQLYCQKMSSLLSVSTFQMETGIEFN